MKREITPADILPVSEFGKIRAIKRKEIVELKKNRRLSVGPFATFYFENYDTMWWQIQEMLFIEQGGEEQLDGELQAYNPLIPKGDELVATIMFEIEDPDRRKRELSRMGGVEETVFLSIGGEIIQGRPEEDQDRTSAEGKASSVQFVHFPFTPAQIAAFRDPNQQVLIGFKHPGYGHMAVMPDDMRRTLALDFGAVN